MLVQNGASIAGIRAGSADGLAEVSAANLVNNAARHDPLLAKS